MPRIPGSHLDRLGIIDGGRGVSLRWSDYHKKTGTKMDLPVMIIGVDPVKSKDDHHKRMASLKESFVNSKKTKYPWEL